MGVTLENMILSKSIILKDRVNSLSLRNEDDIESKNNVLLELDYFLAYLGNEKLPIGEKCVGINETLSKDEFLKYSLKYLISLEKDLGVSNV